MPHAAQLATHTAPPAPVTPAQTHPRAPIDAGLWLFMVAAPFSFAVILGTIIYLSVLSF
ncbi:MAG TPA: hypothetical protein VFZ61_11665 [Polyangiales bacterium]